MLADNLFGRIAFEALRAGVPARHDASRVEHIDRVVGDSLDQESVASGIVVNRQWNSLSSASDKKKRKTSREVP
jgi:hypothetical protein